MVRRRPAIDWPRDTSSHPDRTTTAEGPDESRRTAGDPIEKRSFPSKHHNHPTVLPDGSVVAVDARDLLDPGLRVLLVEEVVLRDALGLQRALAVDAGDLLPVGELAGREVPDEG